MYSSELVLGDSLQENRNECMNDLVTIVGLRFLQSENFLPQHEAGKHTEESTGGELGIHRAECALVNAVLNVFSYRISPRHAGNEHVRQLVAFQGAEQKQPEKGRIVFMSF